MVNKFGVHLEPEASQQTALILKDRCFFVLEVLTERLNSLAFVVTGVSTAVLTTTTTAIEKTWLKNFLLAPTYLQSPVQLRNCF